MKGAFVAPIVKPGARRWVVIRKRGDSYRIERLVIAVGPRDGKYSHLDSYFDTTDLAAPETALVIIEWLNPPHQEAS